MTTDKNNSPLPAPIDVTDPWRGLYQATRLPAPTEYGDIAHPDIPCWPDDREDALDKLVHAQGFDFQIVAGEFTEAALEEGDELYWAEMRAWIPVAPPEGEWRLAWKGDTEDGPYAWFVRPMALRPDPVALAAPGKQQVGEVQGDAATYDEAADLISRLYMARDMQRAGAWSYLFAEAADALAAIAARQPGVQEPRAWLIHWSYIPLESTEVTTSASRVDAVNVLTDPPRIEPLYAAPPAQGIDLGQMVVTETADETDAEWLCRKARAEGWNAYRDALIDQRDAAPGVDRG